MLATRGLAVPLITFERDARSARLAQEHSKLLQSLFNFVSTHPGLAPLGPDPVVEQLVRAKGFAKFDISTLRVSIKGRVLTAIAVPTRVWRDPESRRSLHAVKAEALASGTRCILVPQRWLRAGLRAQVARTLALSHHVKVRREHIKAVKSLVGAYRMMTLSECASRIQGEDDPVGVVLALCARGQLYIDRTHPIGPESWVASMEPRA